MLFRGDFGDFGFGLLGEATREAPVVVIMPKLTVVKLRPNYPSGVLLGQLEGESFLNSIGVVVCETPSSVVSSGGR